MSTYQGIRGLKIRDYTTNPDDPLEGQLWYNKTDQVGKYQIPNVTAAWRTGNNLNNTRTNVCGSGLTQTAALTFAGLAPSPGNGNTYTENYDGTTWTELNDLNTARYSATGFGSNTSAICAGGYTPSAVANAESWDGSSWTEVGDLNTARGGDGGSGISNSAGIIFNNNLNESWNGSSWTELANLNTGRDQSGASGTQTAALGFGGTTPGGTRVANTESWNDQHGLK